MLTLHGKSKPVTMALQVDLQSGAGSAEGSFTIKYQEWGLKNPSTFILRVNDKVEIHVHAVGRFAPAGS
jgi:polyisoprenoid-binding protein YceI